MTTARPTLFTRPDTFFGVCQGIGEDLGIHPNLFRVSFGMAFFFAPLATLATYFALGLVVAATRIAFPVRRSLPARRPIAAVDAAIGDRRAAGTAAGGVTGRNASRFDALLNFALQKMKRA